MNRSTFLFFSISLLLCTAIKASDHRSIEASDLVQFNILKNAVFAKKPGIEEEFNKTFSVPTEEAVLYLFREGFDFFCSDHSDQIMVKIGDQQLDLRDRIANIIVTRLQDPKCEIDE